MVTNRFELSQSDCSYQYSFSLIIAASNNVINVHFFILFSREMLENNSVAPGWAQAPTASAKLLPRQQDSGGIP